ncbi:MAG: VWA domain-containing protein, partial [Planctomycetes bacterium]|nr:VWA domain-containing protein [Planctomycetota bacterium]
GEYGCAPLGEGSWAFPEELRLLPDVPTGARAVFLAPGKALSIELRCDFPNAQPQGAAQALRPRGLVFPLEGKRPQIPMRRALVAIDDGVFQVAVIGQAAAESFAGEAAGEGKAFLVLDVTVVNTGKGGETFQTLEQLKVATRTGEQLAADPASLRGLRPPAALLWIPEGEPRSFQVAFRVPADERKPRLAYSGVTLAKVVDLPPLAGAEVAAAATRPEPSPPPEPAGPAGRPAGEPEKEAKDDKVAKDAKPARAPVEGPETLEKPAKAATPPPPAAKKAPAAPKKAKRDAAPLVPPPPPGEPKGLAGVGLTPEKVNEAIDGGAAFLWRHIVTKDLQGGRYKLGSDQEHAIAALALVHAGAHEKVPDFDAQLREYLSKVEPDRVGAYQAGILCMLVEAYGDPSFLGVLRGATRYLLEAQGPEGSWTYHTRLKDDVYRDPEAEKTILVSGGVPLEGEAAAPELARTTEWRLGQDGDNSVSQYAVLGLHAASRSGLRLSPEVWTRGLAAYRARQGDDGNWYYTGKSSSGYGSMTCAGVCSVAIALHELGEKEPAKDPAVQAGLAWLSRSFSVSEHPGSKGRWHYYYLYALERVGRVLGTDFIGEHEWYPEGARYLVDAQKEDGGWVGEGEEKDPRLAASFALLFLTRATPTLKAQEVRRGGKGLLKTGIRLPPGGRYYFILDASGSMTAELGGKPKWEIARDAVQSLVAALPDASDVALRVYGHRKRAIEPGASEDTALEVPLRRLERAQFDQKLRALRARGKTPLALSLLQAKRDLSGAREEDPVIVVLLTDGGEDTQPRQDPVKAAADFGELEGVALHVVGFDIGREDWSAQLREMVARAHGRYWPAADGPTLERHLRAAVLGEPEGYVVLGAGGEQAARGRFGDTRTLPEGKYVLRVAFGGEEHEQGFWINTDATTSVVFNAERAARGLPSEATPGAARPEGPAQPAAAAPEARPKPPPEPAPKTAPAKFCTECGKPLKPAARFCTECGTKVK